MNKFGAKVKMRHFAPYVKPHFKCAEFGSSSGNIIAAMPCREKIGIEVNTCGRKWGKENLNLTSVDRISKLESNSFDMVITTSVLEHVECPICEVRGILRILKPGGVFVGMAPGMAPTSMTYQPEDINNELQMFGAMELGNIVKGAGFTVNKCWSDVTQWMPGFQDIYNKVGDDEFHRQAKAYGSTHDRLVNTGCVAYKPFPKG